MSALLVEFFYPNFMKVGRIVKYHDVFFKFDNGPYRTMFSEVMALDHLNSSIWMVSGQ